MEKQKHLNAIVHVAVQEDKVAIQEETKPDPHKELTPEEIEERHRKSFVFMNPSLLKEQDDTE